MIRLRPNATASTGMAAVSPGLECVAYVPAAGRHCQGCGVGLAGWLELEQALGQKCRRIAVSFCDKSAKKSSSIMIPKTILSQSRWNRKS